MSQDYSAGQHVGDYEILGILGAGGMGKVYKVRNTISDRVEAMKILLPDLAGQKELADRFLREIKVLASLNHPNIAALRTALTLDNQLVMIMEFVDGVTLSSRIHQGAIPATLAVKYIDQVLDALSYAHKQNIIHRDIKPANVMLTVDENVKLMDFGIARSSTDRSLTVTGTTLGSLNYMPPEQVKGEPADNRSDLYSLGISLYEMVTGRLPFQADSNYAIMAAHLQEPPRPPIVLRPDLPQPLNQIILMALAKDPGQRFQSADAFRAALKTVPGDGATTVSDFSPRSYAPSAPAGNATALFQGPAAQTRGAALPPQRGTAPQATQPMAAAPPPQASGGAPPPSPAATSGHRGLYIALGALVVVAVLFAAGLYLPGHFGTLADRSSGKPTPPGSSTTAAPSARTPSSPAAPTSPSVAIPDSSPTTPAVEPASTGAATPQSAQGTPNTGSDAPSPMPSPASSDNNSPASGKKTSKSKRSSSAEEQSRAVTSTDQIRSEDTALIQENEQRYDDISGRAAAATQSLSILKQQQAAAGYGLRGDIVSAEARLNSDLGKAQAAAQNADAKAAKKYLDMAEAELQTIEKFLGH
jgi:serine/threonine protein kinase